jgi:hypothetical protein
VKQLKVKVRKACKRRKLGKQFQADLKGLSRQLLAAKKMHRRHIIVYITKQR